MRYYEVVVRLRLGGRLTCRVEANDPDDAVGKVRGFYSDSLPGLRIDRCELLADRTIDEDAGGRIIP